MLAAGTKNINQKGLSLMFEQSMIDSSGTTRRSASVVVSFILQCCLIGIGILIVVAAGLFFVFQRYGRR